MQTLSKEQTNTTTSKLNKIFILMIIITALGIYATALGNTIIMLTAAIILSAGALSRHKSILYALPAGTILVFAAAIITSLTLGFAEIPFLHYPTINKLLIISYLLLALFAVYKRKPTKLYEGPEVLMSLPAVLFGGLGFWIFKDPEHYWAGWVYSLHDSVEHVLFVGGIHQRGYLDYALTGTDFESTSYPRGFAAVGAQLTSIQPFGSRSGEALNFSATLVPALTWAVYTMLILAIVYTCYTILRDLNKSPRLSAWVSLPAGFILFSGTIWSYMYASGFYTAIVALLAASVGAMWLSKALKGSIVALFILTASTVVSANNWQLIGVALAPFVLYGTYVAVKKHGNKKTKVSILLTVVLGLIFTTIPVWSFWVTLGNSVSEAATSYYESLSLQLLILIGGVVLLGSLSVLAIYRYKGLLAISPVFVAVIILLYPVYLMLLTSASFNSYYVDNSVRFAFVYLVPIFWSFLVLPLIWFVTKVKNKSFILSTTGIGAVAILLVSVSGLMLFLPGTALNLMINTAKDPRVYGKQALDAAVATEGKPVDAVWDISGLKSAFPRLMDAPAWSDYFQTFALYKISTTDVRTTRFLAYYNAYEDLQAVGWAVNGSAVNSPYTPEYFWQPYVGPLHQQRLAEACNKMEKIESPVILITTNSSKHALPQCVKDMDNVRFKVVEVVPPSETFSVADIG